MRKPSIIIPLFLLGILLIFQNTGAVTAAPNPGHNFSDSIIDNAIYRQPNWDDLLNPGDGSTPPEEAPPEETPPGGETPATPVGYSLDANDYLETRFTGDLGLNINGYLYSVIDTDTRLIFSMETLPAVETAGEDGGETPPSTTPTYYVGIKTTSLGHYQIFFSDFDEGQFRLTLTVKSPYINETMELRPSSQIGFTANDLKLIQFGGSEAPEPGLGPTAEVAVASGDVVYIVEMNGDLVVSARANPMFAGDPVPVPQPQPQAENNGGNNVNVPTNGIDTDTTNIPTGPVGAVGAEFGGSGCFGQLQPMPLGGDFWIWLGALGVFLVTFWKRK